MAVDHADSNRGRRWTVTHRTGPATALAGSPTLVGTFEHEPYHHTANQGFSALAIHS
jgi:hypothetical protein